MQEHAPSKPHIIVVALDIDSHAGSEPGKGWWWSCALSHYFQLHIITQKQSVELCARQTLVQSDQWIFHPTEATIQTWAFPTGYLQYAAWLKEALVLSANIVAEAPIAGLCHVTLGSFRILPRYDTLGIPYTIGPLGGGECSPMRYIWPRPVPVSHKVTESLRPVLNNAFALVPSLRSCLRSAAVVLTTSRESEQVVRRMGATRTKVVFPDAYDNPIDVEAVDARRAAQVEDLRGQLQLLWQGRPLWWKGPDVGLLILRHALNAGVKVQLTMVGNWENAFGRRVRSIADRLGVFSNVRLLGNLPREEFLQLSVSHHAFLATSLHDSGGIPLIEAQAFGLPCLTPGLGGNREAACPRIGVSGGAPDVDGYIRQVVECLRRWQTDPQSWLEESKAAVRFAGRFTNQRLKDYVRDLILPAFVKPRTERS